jgi:hypothetical protein
MLVQQIGGGYQVLKHLKHVTLRHLPDALMYLVQLKMGLDLFARLMVLPGLSPPRPPNSLLNGPEVNITQHRLETNVAFVNGQHSTPDFFNVALIHVTGLFHLPHNSTILVMFVELGGTPLPPRFTGRLQRSQLLMRATSSSLTAISSATVRRIRSSSAPSGVLLIEF